MLLWQVMQNIYLGARLAGKAVIVLDGVCSYVCLDVSVCTKTGKLQNMN